MNFTEFKVIENEKLKIKIYNDIGELKNLYENIYLDSEFYPYQSFVWIEIYQKILVRPDNYCYVVLYFETKPILLIFLKIMKKFGVRWIEFLNGPFTDYNAPVIHKNFEFIFEQNSNITESIFLILKKQFKIDFLLLDNMPEKLMNLYNPLIPKNGFVISSYSQIDTKGDWNAYYSKIKVKIRKDSERQRKVLSRIGSLKFEFQSDQESSRDTLLWLIKHKELRYKSTKVGNLFEESGFLEIFNEISRINNPFVKPMLSTISIDNKIIAAHLGFLCNSKFYYVFPTFDAEWSKYAPGRLLMENLIKEAFQDKNVDYFDLGIGIHGYKGNYMNVSQRLYFSFIPLSYFAYVGLFVSKLYFFLKKMKHKYILNR